MVGDTLVGAAQVLLKAVGPAGRLAYLDRGPVMAGDQPDHLQTLIVAIQEEMRQRSVRALIAQPSTEVASRAMTAAGFGPTDLGFSLPATVTVDLGGDSDDILARMKSKTRYNIRKGLRSALEVRQADGSELPVFHQMLTATAARQGFESNSIQHLARLFEALEPAGQCTMFIAEDAAGPVSATLLVAFGHSVVYKRGAWSGRAGNLHPNEVLHWTAMLWAKEAGFETYDFDGIDPQVARAVLDGQSVPKDATQSVSRFKLGFGGDVVLLPTALSYVPNILLRIGHDRVVTPLSKTRPGRLVAKWVRVR